MKKLRNYFLTGLIVVLPAVVTLYLLWIAFTWIDGILGDILPFFIKRSIPGLGFIITILLIMLAGVLAKNFLGKKLISFGEWILVKIPLARTIYLTTKQIVNTLLVKDKLSFKRVVLVEYPRKGIYTIGFITNEGKGEIQDKLGQEVTSVFFPTTPNPTSGWLALVPNDDIIHLDMSIEDGVKLIISGGILFPSDQPGNKDQLEQNIINFESVEEEKKGE